MSELRAEDLNDIAARLRGRQAELRRQVDEARADTGRKNLSEIAGRVRDPGEESVADLVASTNLTLLDRNMNELREVDSTLRRIEEGEYGRCRECGGPIERERLLAYPTAQRCVECASRSERARNGGQDATPSL